MYVVVLFYVLAVPQSAVVQGPLSFLLFDCHHDGLSQVTMKIPIINNYSTINVSTSSIDAIITYWHKVKEVVTTIPAVLTPATRHFDTVLVAQWRKMLFFNKGAIKYIANENFLDHTHTHTGYFGRGGKL